MKVVVNSQIVSRSLRKLQTMGITDKLSAIYRDNGFVVATLTFMILNPHKIIMRLLSPASRIEYMDKYFMLFESDWERDQQVKSAIFKPIHDLTNKRGKRHASDGSDSIRILEVGPGTGHNFRYYPSGVQVTTIDPSQLLGVRATEAAKRRSDVVFHHVTGDACNMTMFEDESFDFVVATNVFCCIPDYHRAIKEIHRVLKKVGTLFD